MGDNLEPQNLKRALRCSIKNCPNCRYKGNNMGKRFFTFPRPEDTGRMLQWKLACSDEKIMKKEPLWLHKNNRVCSDHFESCFMTNYKLNKNAAPTLNLFLKPSSTDVATQTENSGEVKFKQPLSHSQTQTSKELFSNTPRENKLRTLIKSKNKIIRQLNMAKLKYEECLGAICSEEAVTIEISTPMEET